ncbi:ubiquitin carboxyl-terminal hydrolase [Colletotrichum plurivorum]|uniref:ubiquitinyl hydrolase 1 n=1 Tax=Colletotrichum plurivorum TaxID=2175906 RepID=A0A8H6K9Z1_9PEZI|nr:ubiquitin carboxyl-terminal hydrolase [Colletotrichum plurivorum]
MSPDDSVPMTQHWEGNSPKVKPGLVGKSGRLAPRWAQDLLNSELDVASFVKIPWDPNARCSRKNASHILVTVGNQSTAEGRDKGILSCVCTTCDFHFLIRTAYDPDHVVCLCQPAPIHFPPKETDYYLHHLVRCVRPAHGHDETAEYHPAIRESLIACENFACSAPRCTFHVSVEISRPRLKREWVQLLIDQQRIRDNLARAREHAPDRFKDARDDWCSTAPSVLNTYLRDLLDKPNPRNISQRNKRFQVVFGEECYVIFKAIQFSEESLIKDGVEEPCFVPPTLESGTPGTPTKLHMLRAVVEDMQAETENLICRGGKSGDNRSPAGSRLFKELQCFNYPQNKVIPRAIEAHRILGVLPDFDKALIFYAYNRQSALCEERRPDYVQALRDIAQETADDEFQTRAIQELTMVERLPTATQHGAGDELEQQAYSFFSLQHTATDDAVITAFNKKLEHSPSQADSAREMLQIIGRHRSNERILNHASGPMDLSTAYRVVESEPDWDNSTIMMMCEVKLNKHPNNKATLVQVIEALTVIAGIRPGVEISVKLDKLQAELVRMNQQPEATRAFSVDAGIVHETTAPRLDLPAGLENIGNTCYLNSILQYLRTAVPVRELLSRYSEYELGQDESDVASRRIGSAKVKIETAEAVIARIFVEELGRLLEDLDNTRETAIRPSQRLANAVLLPTDQIREDSGAEETKRPDLQTQEVLGAHFPLPPPLPARPAPGPPTKNVDHVEDVNMINVTVEPVSEDASSVSSQTLVSMPDVDHDKRDENKSDIRLVPSFSKSTLDVVMDGSDAKMTGVDTPVLSVEQRVLKALETQKRSSGTDQQDVEEVMGSIINRLQAAIKPSDIGEDGVQWDPIMKTFFFTQAFHTRLATQETFKSDPPTMERSIAAYPAETGPSTIQEALGRNLDLQRVEGNIVRFMSIGDLPPILHVLIQRTSYDGRKNMNPVEVSEMLYFDRYMHTEENEELFKLRQKGWALQQRLEQLSGIPKTNAEDIQSTDSFLHDFVQIDKSDTEDSSSLLVGQPASSLKFAGEESSFPTYHQSELASEEVDRPVIDGADFAGRDQINSMREDEAKRLKADLEELFSGHKEQAYCLHAVICHSGQMNAGHYWVWIHDFEDGIWRKYNDRTVTENASTEEVLKMLNSNGDPYYLCYVREEKKLDLVRVPKRNIPESAEQDADGDIELIDVSEAKPELQQESVSRTESGS